MRSSTLQRHGRDHPAARFTWVPTTLRGMPESERVPRELATLERLGAEYVRQSMLCENQHNTETRAALRKARNDLRLYLATSAAETLQRFTWPPRRANELNDADPARESDGAATADARARRCEPHRG